MRTRRVNRWFVTLVPVNSWLFEAGPVFANFNRTNPPLRLDEIMLRVTLLNAAPDTGNLGVSALGYSVIAGLSRRINDLDLTVADSGFGLRPDSLSVDGRPFKFIRCGIRSSRRLHRSDSLWNIRVSSIFGGGWNQIARRLKDQDFALDITGGDSFTDLYGMRTFRIGAQIKNLFLDWGVPLGLLPQTYGPYQTPKNRAIASEIIRRAQFAWARDDRSFQSLRDLLGSHFDSERHRGGVDVAFLLESVQPSSLDTQTMDWLSDRSKLTVGLNISGLIYNDPDSAVSRYGFVADYNQVIIQFVRRLLAKSDANVLLIPHVIAKEQFVESDVAACKSVVKLLETESRGRLRILPSLADPREAKWVISQCGWFCGTRMHATIAGLSTGVPTAAIAYSLKTAGVFETCDQGDHVADPRELNTDAMVERLWASFSARDAVAKSLKLSLPPVLNVAKQQMDAIASSCKYVRAAAPLEVPLNES